MPDPAGAREVVAGVLHRGDRTALLRRSDLVGSDRGLWHCVTGYLEPGVDPCSQLLTELHEETGLSADAVTVRACGPLDLAGGGHRWRVHVFDVATTCATLTLNWEHDAYRWISTDDASLPRVHWLDAVVARTRLTYT